MDSRSRVVVGWLAVVGLLVSAGCVVEPTRTMSPARAPAPAPAPAPPPSPMVAEAAPPQQPWVEPVAPGYMYCCGNPGYRLEIGCADLDMKCYEQTDDGWRWTYGRHCKVALGEACYLNGCDNRCR